MRLRLPRAHRAASDQPAGTLRDRIIAGPRPLPSKAPFSIVITSNRQAAAHEAGVLASLGLGMNNHAPAGPMWSDGYSNNDDLLGY
jgi:hypothetical protein